MHSHNHDRLHRNRDLYDDAKSFIHKHNPLQKRAPATVYRTVYKTMDPTFTGPIAGYTTYINSPDNNDRSLSSIVTKESSFSTRTTSEGEMTTSPAEENESESVVESEPFLLASITTTSDTSAPTTLAVNTKDNAQLGPESSTVSSALPISTSLESSETSSSGSNSAAKAGIAMGVLGAILVVFGLVWFVIRNRRNKAVVERQSLEDDEHLNGAFNEKTASVHTTRTTLNAPRLSLRPVTQFLPSLDRRNSKCAAAPPSRIHLETPNQSPWERPMTSDSNHTENPFGNHAESANSPGYGANDTLQSPSIASATPLTAQFNSFVTGSNPSAPSGSPNLSSPGTPDSNDAAVTGVAVVVSNLTRNASMRRKNSPAPLDLTTGPPDVPVLPSPTGTDYSFSPMSPDQVPSISSSAAAITAAGGPASSTVHRVQLDFVPTLEDEMKLKAGQLVRLLHEYDDGWALCIRLDRSQQGVVPRTCLSARPVKPRPQPGAPRPGPPVNPNGNGDHSHSFKGRPGSNGQMRPRSPVGQPLSPADRPMSPYRPQSPARSRPQSPAGRPQSHIAPQSGSPSGGQRRFPPPGPSPMNPNPQPYGIERKLVPGQAI